MIPALFLGLYSRAVTLSPSRVDGNMPTQNSPGDARCFLWEIAAPIGRSNASAPNFYLSSTVCTYNHYISSYITLSASVWALESLMERHRLIQQTLVWKRFQIPKLQVNVWPPRTKPASSLQSFKVGWASSTEMGTLKLFTCCKSLNLIS